MKENRQVGESRLTVEQAAIEIGAGFCAELQRHGFMTPGPESQRMIDSIARVIRRIERLIMADPNADLRQKFEEWAAQRTFSLKYPEGSDGYPSASTQAAWLAWQAAQPSSADLEKLAREIADTALIETDYLYVQVLQLLTRLRS